MAPRNPVWRHQPWWRTSMAGAAVAAVLSAMPVAALAETSPGPVDSIAAVDMTAQFSFSSDGVGYSSAVPDLFAGSPKLVPGEALAEELWVRNENAVAVDVSVTALAPVGAGEAGEEARVRLTPSPVVALQPGAAAPVQVRVRLPESAGNESQGITVAVRLRVNATEAANSRGGELGPTGATPGIWPLAAAALMGGVAALLGAIRRRRAETIGQTTESEDHGE